jgi:hypothetical protein
MLQVIMLVVGIWYVFELLTIGSSGLKLGLPPEVLVEWRAQRKKQYLWGIAAGWGSLVAGILTSVGMTPSYPTTTDVARAQLSMIVVTAIVLIGCLVVSIAASKKAKSFEQKWTSLGYGMPGAYPPAANQPGAYPPSAQAPAPATPIAAPLAPVGEGPLMTENQSQGTVTCLNCGAQFPAVGARFCPVCGGAVAVSQAASWAPFAAPAPMPAAPTPPVAPPSVPSAPAPDYGQQGQGQPPTYSPPPAYGHPPAPALYYTQPQGYGSAPGYGYGPAHARRNSTPIFVGLGLIGLVAVIIAGALLLSLAGGPHTTSAPSAIALATPTAGATPTPAPIPTPAPTPTPTSAPTSGAASIDQLRPFIPSAIWSTCVPGGGAGTLLEIATCSSTGVDGLLYLLYDNAADLKVAFDGDVQTYKAIPATAANTCANHDVYGTWTRGTGTNSPDQGLLCYEATDSSGDLITWIEQSDPATNVLLQAFDLGDKRAALYTWWKNNANVVEP